MKRASLLSLCLLLAPWGQSAHAEQELPSPIMIPSGPSTSNIQQRQKAQKAIIRGLLALRHPKTQLAPSHWGHPGYEQLTFTYDQALTAIVLKTNGYPKEAEQTLDYFMTRLDIPTEVAAAKADTNNVYGFLKLFQAPGSHRLFKSLTNAVNISSSRTEGRGILEIWTTPGPLSFMALACLQVNPQKYGRHAIELGNILLAMQDADGGVRDGDREPEKIHTEPHMDAFAVFEMLHSLTGDPKWKRAADRAYDWFVKHVFAMPEGRIWQGVWDGQLHKVIAEDTYAWTMATPAGDRMPIDALKQTTYFWLNHFLSRVTVPLPDGSTRTLILVDFADSTAEECQRVRHGIHPMGSIEWTGGAILALQKNAVRFWKAGDLEMARFCKAMAEILLDNSLNAFYYVQTNKSEPVYTSFYATGQGLRVGNFGSSEIGREASWETPYFCSRLTEKDAILGGALVASWPLLPYQGCNPFILGDSYKKTYDGIPDQEQDRMQAQRFIQKTVASRTYTESPRTDEPYSSLQIIEPSNYNRKMWAMISAAEEASSLDDWPASTRYWQEAIRWANLVVGELKWRQLARRDNAMKQKEIGGLVNYPWGTTYPENKHETHTTILRYPLLNEVATAMWGLAVANRALGHQEEVQRWISTMIDEVPLHQIAAVATDSDPDDPLIIGYWNALAAWEDGVQAIDQQMNRTYREVLRSKRLPSAKPTMAQINTHHPI